MKIWGYTERQRESGSGKPSPMAEITIAASPDELRRIAGFLQQVAGAMENHGDSFRHEYLADNVAGFKEAPQLIVFNPELIP